MSIELIFAVLIGVNTAAIIWLCIQRDVLLMRSKRNERSINDNWRSHKDDHYSDMRRTDGIIDALNIVVVRCKPEKYEVKK